MRVFVTHEKKIVILISLITILLSVIILAILVPTVSDINKTAEDISSLKMMLEKKYNIAKSMQRTRKEIEKIEMLSANYNSYFFQLGDELRLITDLEDIANNNHVQQKIENPNWPNTADHDITIRLSVSGEYLQLLNYMNELEKTHYFFNIGELHLTPSSGSNPKLAVLNLTLFLYVNSF